MPSAAYINFLHIRIDVLKLIETHSHFSKNKKGKKNLGHLTRSAVVMLCAAWERYNEDLLLEAITYVKDNLTDINLLPKEVKKTISTKVKEDKNEIKVLDLAGTGWKALWHGYAKVETEGFNTPKSDKLNFIFKRYLGFSAYTSFWKPASAPDIDAFVSERGKIAHNGNRASYVRMTTLRDFQDLVVKNVIEIDSRMATELQVLAHTAALAWIKDYSTDLNYYK